MRSSRRRRKRTIRETASGRIPELAWPLGESAIYSRNHSRKSLGAERTGSVAPRLNRGVETGGIGFGNFAKFRPNDIILSMDVKYQLPAVSEKEWRPVKWLTKIAPAAAPIDQRK